MTKANNGGSSLLSRRILSSVYCASSQSTVYRDDENLIEDNENDVRPLSGEPMPLNFVPDERKRHGDDDDKRNSQLSKSSQLLIHSNDFS